MTLPIAAQGRPVLRAVHRRRREPARGRRASSTRWSSSYDRLEERVAEIQALEKRGDEIDREITQKLEDAFITPFDREDIHELDGHGSTTSSTASRRSPRRS